MGKCKDCQHLCRTFPAYPNPEMEEARLPETKEPAAPAPRRQQVKRLTWCINSASPKFKNDVNPDTAQDCFVQYVPVKREIPDAQKRKSGRPKDAKHKNAGVPSRQPKLSDKPPMQYNH